MTDAVSFDRRLAVATRALFRLAGALAPGLAERGHGSIVPAGSGAARTPAPVGAAHGASKAAVELLARYRAAEVGPAGVRVDAVSPGPVRTEPPRRCPATGPP
ncbi:SDR family oxidoreductase [Streptomyces sp. Amel2xE9]|uniref:SDR family oxidoreductase n=1 Tax=unclassified Streptomyces TaxID=2593676 RepID=UPI0003703C69|nr:SDR family oxidoreductase [Streptomyces sp. Amel2xE9]